MANKPAYNLKASGYMLLGFMLLQGCEKIEPERLILIRTGTVSDISHTSCAVSGVLLDVGGSGVTQHGFCTSLTADLKDATESVKLGPKSEKGNYTGTVSGLQPGTRYHLWSFASGGGATIYGEPATFTTLAVELPSVETGKPFNIAFSSAECTGNVASDGGSAVTERGICWSKTPSPTVNNARCSSGTGTGDYACSMESLEPDTRYYVKAYATNSAGTGYGNEEQFVTAPEPTVPQLTTHLVEGIGTTEATCGGTITDNGGSEVITKGLCWSTHAMPTMADNDIPYASGGTEPFTIKVTGLSHNTLYYIRAFATNGAGTGYGNEREFRTSFNCGSQLVDERDGKVYNTVSIGQQCWMAENLNAGDMILSDAEPVEGSGIEKYCYDNDSGNCELYGGLYTWDELMQYTMIESSQGVCPEGWHIPSDYEWKILEREIGMSVASSDSASWRGTDEGGKLKAKGITFWNPPNTGATNALLFSALPSGMMYHDGSFSGMGDFAVYWTSTPFLETQAWYRYLHTSEARILRVDGFRPNTTPVRCVKD